MNKSKLIALRNNLLRDEVGGVSTMPIHADRLVGAPTPFPDEAFSSWTERIALHFHSPRSAPLKRFGVTAPAFWVDAGRIEIDLRRIALMTGAPVELVAAFNGMTRTLMALPKYAYMTADLALRTPTFRYCEKCFQEDSVPYGRRLWRISFVHMCPKHRTILRDSCPQCRTPIRDGYRDRRHTALNICHKCQHHLGNTKSNYLAEKQTAHTLRRQIHWIKFASALGSFQHGLDFWYGTLNPQDLIDEFGQIRGQPIDGKFYDRLWPILGLGCFSFKMDQPLFFRKDVLQVLFEAKAVRVPPHKKWWQQASYIGGEYTDISNGQIIADAISKCQQLHLGDSLWRELRGSDHKHSIACISRETWDDGIEWAKSMGKFKTGGANLFNEQPKHGHHIR